MNILKIIILITFTQTCFLSPVLADDSWIEVSSTDDGDIWEAKAGSLEFTETKEGEHTIILTGRGYYANSKELEFEKWQVTAGDCVAEYGTLITLNLKGEFVSEDEFMFNGGTVAASLAETICALAMQMIMKEDNKSI